jgi:RimJ/RimL family protein N-acetyltransferase
MGKYGRRLLFYLKQNGFKQTIGHAIGLLRRRLGRYYTVLFCAELIDFNPAEFMPVGMRLVRKDTWKDLTSREIELIICNKEETAFTRTSIDRFTKKSILWLIFEDDHLVGYSWSVDRYPIAGYYFPLPKHSIHLFDQEIFPDYRGHGYNGIATNEILKDAKRRGLTHAYISVGEWNEKNLRSMMKTAFKPIGVARRRRSGHRIIVTWKEMYAGGR